MMDMKAICVILTQFAPRFVLKTLPKTVKILRIHGSIFKTFPAFHPKVSVQSGWVFAKCLSLGLKNNGTRQTR